MRAELDYQDIAMFFDKMVRAHDVDRVLAQVLLLLIGYTTQIDPCFQARRMFAEYLNEDWTPSPQPPAGQVMGRKGC